MPRVSVGPRLPIWKWAMFSCGGQAAAPSRLQQPDVWDLGGKGPLDLGIRREYEWEKRNSRNPRPGSGCRVGEIPKISFLSLAMWLFFFFVHDSLLNPGYCLLSCIKDLLYKPQELLLSIAGHKVFRWSEPSFRQTWTAASYSFS